MSKIHYLRTLDYYDGPQVFEARDAIGGHYVAVLGPGNEFRYLLAGVAPEQLHACLEGLHDLRDLLMKTDRASRYTTTTVPSKEGDVLTVEPFRGSLDEYLPEPGFMLEAAPAIEPAPSTDLAPAPGRLPPQILGSPYHEPAAAPYGAPRGDVGRYSLKVDGGWGLLELANFGKQYVQLYSFLHALDAEAKAPASATSEPVYATDAMPDELATASIPPEGLFDEQESEEEQDTLEVARLKRASKAYPWRGGWSTVNFFRALVTAVPHAHTPRVAKLAYASPGSIDLDLSVPIAETISRLVAIVASAPDDAIDQVYRVLRREAQARKLLGRNVKDLTLRADDSMFVQTAGGQMLSLMGLERYHSQMVRLTDGNAFAIMKITFSLYRRIRVLAKLQNMGKIEF